MTTSSAHPSRVPERRSAERFPCHAVTFCRVTDVLDQVVLEAGVRDISAGGICLVLEASYPPGARLGAELVTDDNEACLFVWLRVEYSDICCPGSRDRWLTGCSFPGEVPREALRPFMNRPRARRRDEGPRTQQDVTFQGVKISVHGERAAQVLREFRALPRLPGLPGAGVTELNPTGSARSPARKGGQMATWDFMLQRPGDTTREPTQGEFFATERAAPANCSRSFGPEVPDLIFF